MSIFIDKFKACRRAGVPIVGVETLDPAATIDMIRAAFPKAPVMQWDIQRGLTPASALAEPVVSAICGGDNPALSTGNPSEMLAKITAVPEKTIVLMHQANALLESTDQGVVLPVSQGIWNLRDVFKAKQATLVLLGTSIVLPTFLRNDVMVLSEELPGVGEIKKIVTEVAEAAGLQQLPNELSTGYAKSLLGLSAFAAEQSFATSIQKNGNGLLVDEKALWERKCKVAEQTRGLSIYRGAETYKDVIGYENAKGFLKKMMSGPDAPEVYIFIDEIEKQLAGFGTDTSGVATEMMGKMLTWMQDQDILGVTLIGAGGTGKSLVGKATGNEAQKPTVMFDLSAMKGSLVGQSTNNIIAAQKMVNGMAGGGRIMVIATCNRFATLPPELKRRFSLGTFFFDLPAADERASIWEYYMEKFKLESEDDMMPDDDGWTGAEIKNCCNIAWRLNTTLVEAAKYVVPISKSAGDEIQKLRDMAEGKFISASNSGFYKQSRTAAVSAPRKFSREE